jgi:hypothetical protein
MQFLRWKLFPEVEHLALRPLPDISNNVGSVKLFLSTLLHSVGGVVLFVFCSFCIDDHGSFAIYRVASVRPRHLFDQNFDHDYLFKPLRSEWDVHSSAQASTSHHVRYRAVPRTNRTPLMANTHNCSATSSRAVLPRNDATRRDLHRFRHTEFYWACFGNRTIEV